MTYLSLDQNNIYPLVDSVFYHNFGQHTQMWFTDVSHLTAQNIVETLLNANAPKEYYEVIEHLQSVIDRKVKAPEALGRISAATEGDIVSLDLGYKDKQLWFIDYGHSYYKPTLFMTRLGAMFIGEPSEYIRQYYSRWAKDNLMSLSKEHLMFDAWSNDHTKYAGSFEDFCEARNINLIFNEVMVSHDGEWELLAWEDRYRTLPNEYSLLKMNRTTNQVVYLLHHVHIDEFSKGLLKFKGNIR